MKPLYQEIAGTFVALENCKESNNTEWIDRWEKKLDYIERNCLPSGAGIDSGCHFDMEKSNGNKIVINTSFHHINEHGYYDGWEDYVVTVYPSLAFGIEIKIIGKNKNFIKDYLGDLFYEILKGECKEIEYKEIY